MKFCKNCGASLTPGQKVCTQCGTKIEQPVVAPTTNNEVPKQETIKQETPNQTSPNVNETTKNQSPPIIHKDPSPISNKTKLIIGAVIGFVVLLFIAFKLISGSYAPNKVGENIAKAVQNKDADKLSKYITSSDDAMNKTEAKAFIDYLAATDESNEFISNIRSTSKSVAENKSMQSVYVGSHEIMKISPNGKAFGLFSKYAFNIPKRNVSLYGSEDSDLKIKLNDKSHNISIKQNEDNKIGTFPLGNYDLPAEKKVNGKTFKGKLAILMSENTVKEDFNYEHINVTMDGSYNLDPDSIKIFVDGKETKASHSNGYKIGPFEKGQEIEVYAEGKLGDKKFKSTKVKHTVEKSDGMTQEVKVSFDEDLISDYQTEVDKKDSKKREEQSDRTSINVTSDDFFQSYTKVNHLDSYKDVKVGMKKSEVEDLLGKDSEFIDTSQENLRAYGNIGIDYDDKDKVKRILVVPDSYEDIDYDGLLETFGTPKEKTKTKKGETMYYLDGTRGNGFVLVIVMDDNDHIKYITQKPEESSDSWAQ